MALCPRRGRTSLACVEGDRTSRILELRIISVLRAISEIFLGVSPR